jgi:hypothetical protein
MLLFKGRMTGKLIKLAAGVSLFAGLAVSARAADVSLEAGLRHAKPADRRQSALFGYLCLRRA